MRELPHIVILGAGYAGLSALHGLKGFRQAKVTLVDRNAYHTLVTELHLAAAHRKPVSIPLEPYTRGAQLFPAEVTGVDLDARVIHTASGDLGFDALILALGSVTNFYRIPGLAAHAVELKRLEDAETIFERFTAMHHPAYSGPRRVFIGGAGLTGVELATELAVRGTELARRGGVPPASINLVEAGDKILPALDATARQRALETLGARGVKLWLGRRIVEASADGVKLEGDETLSADLIVWTGGVSASEIATGAHLERGPGQRIRVNANLEVLGYERIYAVGDIALALDANGAPVPTTGQNAGHQGSVAAHNLRAALEGKPQRAYRPSSIGELVSLGGLLGVGWVQLPWNLRLRLAGGLAGLVKRASEWRHTLQAQGRL